MFFGTLTLSDGGCNFFFEEIEFFGRVATVSTTESWKASVHERFYEQFVNSLPKEVDNYLKELNKLDKSFNSADLHINEFI